MISVYEFNLPLPLITKEKWKKHYSLNFVSIIFAAYMLQEQEAHAAEVIHHY